MKTCGYTWTYDDAPNLGSHTCARLPHGEVARDHMHRCVCPLEFWDSPYPESVTPSVTNGPLYGDKDDYLGESY